MKVGDKDLPEVRLTFAGGGWILVPAGLLLLALLTWAFAGVIAGHRPQGGSTVESYGFDLSTALVPKSELTPSGQPRDTIRSLEATGTMAGSAMAAFNAEHRKKYVVTNDRVIGVVLNGEARAYPISVAEAHEAIHDTLGGVPILVADLPDLRPAVARLLGPGAVPDDTTLAEANASIRAWVEADPRRCLLSLQPLLDGAGGETLRSAFAADGLHASAKGEVQLAIAVLERLAACKVVPRDAFLADREAVLARVRPRTIVPAPSSREASRATIDRVAALRRAEATLDIALASGDRSQLQRAFRALFDPELVEERAFFQVQLLPPQLAKHPEARAELVSVYRPLRLAAARPDSGPAEQTTVIEIALILDDSEAALEAAAALGRLADRDAKAPVPVERSLSRRLRELVYVTTSDRSPLVAAATVVDVRLAIAETVDRAARSQRAGSIAARQGVAVRSRSDAELLAQLAKILEAAGRTQDAATVRAAERQSGP